MKCALLIYPKPGSHEALGEDEYKEVLGGYFVFDASDLDETLEVAQRIPAVRRRGRDPSARRDPRGDGALIEQVFRREWGRVLARDHRAQPRHRPRATRTDTPGQDAAAGGRSTIRALHQTAGGRTERR